MLEKNNGSIKTEDLNKECREAFKFGKTKAFVLLKNLEELGKIKKVGKGSLTRYTLVD